MSAEAHARDAVQRAEAAPIRVGNRYAITRSTVARAAVALGGFALIVAAGAILLRPTPDEHPAATVAGAVAVPNVIGLSELRADAVVTGAGLVFGDPITVRLPDRAEGTVVAQDPRPGHVGRCGIDAGRHGLDPTAARRRAGYPRPPAAAAIVTLTGLGLRIDEVVPLADAQVPAGHTIDTQPPAGSRLPEGSSVDLRVSDDMAAPSPSAKSPSAAP